DFDFLEILQIHQTLPRALHFRGTIEVPFIEAHLTPDHLIPGTLIADNINTPNVDFGARTSRKAQVHYTRSLVYRHRRRHIGKCIAAVCVGIRQRHNIASDGLTAIDFPNGEVDLLAQFLRLKDTIACQDDVADLELFSLTRNRDRNDDAPCLTVNLHHRLTDLHIDITIILIHIFEEL